MSSRAIVVVISATLAASASGLTAQAIPPVPSVKQAIAENAGKTRVPAFEHAAISLDNAISIAESTMGGIVVDADFQVSNGRPVYLMRTFLGWDGPASGQSVSEGTIDADTGKVIGKSKTIPLGQLDREHRSGLAGLQPWYASLGEAAIAAEDYGGGKAIRAQLTQRKGQAVFEVTIVKGTSPIQVAVDAIDGRVMT